MPGKASVAKQILCPEQCKTYHKVSQDLKAALAAKGALQKAMCLEDYQKHCV